MIDDWAEAGKRHDTDDGGHWHEPSYPSCVVCRMRDLEAESKANQHDFLMMLANRNELSDEWLKLKDQIEEMRLNFDGNLTAMGHPPHPNCKFRRFLQEADRNRLRELEQARDELWKTTTAAAETLGALQASYDTVCEEQADTLRELATLIDIARAPFMTPDKDRSDDCTDVWEFDGVCCPVCDVMSSDVLDHLIVEDDYAHNRWLGTRLEALRTFLAPTEPEELDGGDELVTRHDLTCSYDDCVAPPGSEDHQLRDRTADPGPSEHAKWGSRAWREDRPIPPHPGNPGSGGVAI